MPDDTREVNFDSLVGPTYNYAALGPGNLASMASRGRIGKPKAAALDGLDKMGLLMKLGVTQALLPPLPRPSLQALYRIGLLKDEGLLEASNIDQLAAHLASAMGKAPHFLAAAFSASSIWTANSATVSPSCDSDDQKVHFTPANMISAFHRSLEADGTEGLLRQIFSNPNFFKIHRPLPCTDTFADEGAANHMRFSTGYGDPALNVFVYGREGYNERNTNHQHRPRQTRAASEAIARLHGLSISADRTVFLLQSQAAMDRGVFHNDVIAASNLDLFLYHEKAFSDTARAVCDLANAFFDLTGKSLRLLEIRDSDLSLEQAAASYLFNSQIVVDGSGKTVIVSPRECQVLPAAVRVLTRLTTNHDRPIDKLIFTNLTSSMRNGGGPACLRLRVPLTWISQTRADWGGEPGRCRAF